MPGWLTPPDSTILTVGIQWFHPSRQVNPMPIFGISLSTVRRFVARMLSQIRNFLRHQVLSRMILAPKRNIF